MELFTPNAAGQLYLIVFSDEAFTWTNEFVPKVRWRYHGLLVQKIDLGSSSQHSDIMSVADFTRWDYVSTNVFCTADPEDHRATTYGEWRRSVRQVLGRAHSAQQTYQARGVILGTEVYGSQAWGRRLLEEGTQIWGHWVNWNDAAHIEAFAVRLWDILFEETLGGVDGYAFFTCWPGASLFSLATMAEHEGQSYTTYVPGPPLATGLTELLHRYFSMSDTELELYLDTG